VVLSWWDHTRGVIHILNKLCTGKCRAHVTAVTIGGANSVLSCTKPIYLWEQSPMFLKRIIASVASSLFNRSARAQHAPAEECIIGKRLRELMDVTPHIPLALSPTAAAVNTPSKTTES
jgi:hypothetical protein